jgi:hypothetical protein
MVKECGGCGEPNPTNLRCCERCGGDKCDACDLGVGCGCVACDGAENE